MRKRLDTKITAARRGTTVLETIVAGIVLAAAISIALTTLNWVLREQRASHRQQDAVQEVQNVLERMTARPWDEITDEKFSTLTPSDDVRRQLPGAALKVSVIADPQAADAKRVRVALVWKQRRELPEAEVAATAWVYRNGVAP